MKPNETRVVDGRTLHLRNEDPMARMYADGNGPSTCRVMQFDIMAARGDVKIDAPLCVTLRGPALVVFLLLMKIYQHESTEHGELSEGQQALPICELTSNRELFTRLGATYEPLPLDAYSDAAMRDESPEDLPALPESLLRKLAPGSGSVH